MSDGGVHAETTASPSATPAVSRTKRQRRPTGAPPPLPRRIAVTTTAWVALAAILVAGAFLVSERTPGARHSTGRAHGYCSNWRRSGRRG